MRILALADRRDPSLGIERLRDLRPDLVVGCGDLSFDYLENVVTVVNKPLLYVPGADDPDLSKDRDALSGLVAGSVPQVMLPDFRAMWEDGPGPQGCINADVRIVEASGLRVAGLGGMLDANPGPNRYPLGEMRRRARRLRRRVRRRRVDVLLTHMPPAGGTATGSAIVRDLVERLRPALAVHGVASGEEWMIGETRVVAAAPSRTIEL